MHPQLQKAFARLGKRSLPAYAMYMTQVCVAVDVLAPSSLLRKSKALFSEQVTAAMPAAGSTVSAAVATMTEDARSEALLKFNYLSGGTGPYSEVRVICEHFRPRIKTRSFQDWRLNFARFKRARASVAQSRCKGYFDTSAATCRGRDLQCLICE
jgi:hypothetical protein